MGIRLATYEDIKEIEVLLYQVHDVHATIRPDLFKKGMKKYSEDEIKEIIDDLSRPIYVYEEDKILGYAFCAIIENNASSLQNIKTLYIDDLCVLDTCRNKHVGSKLFEYVCAKAKELDCYNVTLNVWAGNDSAMNFYEKKGMKIQKIGMEYIV